MSLLWVSVLLGIVEGLTEFLPISSTGHLYVTSELIGFSELRAQVFQIFIQLGAILAVVAEYRVKLFALVRGIAVSPQARSFAWRIGVASLPFAVVGFALEDLVDRWFSARAVALALIAGAVWILVVEALPLRARTRQVEDVSMFQVLGIGLAQCLALWPGFSRSAATILGGMAAGLERRAATEFSFLLAIPVMSGVTVYKLVSDRHALLPGDAGWLALATVVSFLVAWGAIRWLLGFVSSHDFRVFAWYRIALGLAILVFFRA